MRVNTESLAHNVREIAAFVRTKHADTQLYAVVKANGYGHGLVESARIAVQNGAACVAVTSADESLRLAQANLAVPILQFLPPSQTAVEHLIRANILMTVGSLCDIDTISAACEHLGAHAQVHLKIDTGMGRLGELPKDALTLAEELADNKHINLAGVYTHCANAVHSDIGKTDRQYAMFSEFLQKLSSKGINPGVRHFASSAVLLRRPEYALDAVRIGTLLYGQYSGRSIPRSVDLRDTWTFETYVAAIKVVPKGTAVGYGSEFVTRRVSRLAVIGVGYAHGFGVAPVVTSAGLRELAVLVRNKMRGHTFAVEINGHAVPIVGRVGMQTCVADVTGLKSVQVGNIVAVPSRRINTPADILRIYEGLD